MSVLRLEWYILAGMRYLQLGLEQRHIPPGTTGTACRFLCTAPNGAVWGPTESSAQLTSAPAPPASSSSAGPKPTPQWPCCLQAERQRGRAKRAGAEKLEVKEMLTSSRLLPFLVARYRLSELNAKTETPILGFARSGSGLTTGSWTGGEDSSSGAGSYKRNQLLKSLFLQVKDDALNSELSTAHICCGC